MIVVTDILVSGLYIGPARWPAPDMRELVKRPQPILDGPEVLVNTTTLSQ